MNKDIDIAYVITIRNGADTLTKPLSTPLLKKNCHEFFSEVITEGECRVSFSYELLL